MLKRSSKSLAIFAAASALALVVGLFPVAQAQQPPLSVQGDVTIVADNCGIVLDSASSQLSFGNLANNQESIEQATKFTNNGNIDGLIAVKGTSWVDGADPGLLVMNVGATHFDLSSGTSYGSKFVLTDQNQNTLIAKPGLQSSISWQLKASLVNAAYQGNAKQQITISSVC